jgi:signal transduction protein with GAF and PtsI domain
VSAAGLTALCTALRAVTGAAAVSVAASTDEGLTNQAADGVGGDAIVGTTLTDGRGLANFVAASGQSLSISGVESDPRFARDVAERSGYVPTSMLLVPVLSTEGDVAGVISILDRASTLGDVDAREVAGRFADVATHLLSVLSTDPLADRVAGLDGPGRRAILAMIEALGG